MRREQERRLTRDLEEERALRLQAEEALDAALRERVHVHEGVPRASAVPPISGTTGRTACKAPNILYNLQN